MKCSKCKRENKPTDRFCIFCGFPLPAPKAKDAKKQPEVLEELSWLKEQVGRINDRLTSLESRQGQAISQPLSKPIQPVLKREAAITRAEEAPPSKRRTTIKAVGREWEQILGGSWLARIGVVALIIGMGFFLKYAFDRQWISPAGQIILGVIAGLIMLFIGYRWRKRYTILAQALSGGGIAVLYLSIFASFAIYDLVNFYVAAALLLLVSIFSVILALRYDSMALAIIGIFGAFVAPFILGVFGGGGPEGSQVEQSLQLLVYVIIIDIGVLGLSTFRNWRWFILLALLCSLASFGGWYYEFGQETSIAISMVFITLTFLLFVGATALFHIIWKRTPEVFDYALIIINNASYFGISLSLMWDDFRAWMGGFVFLLALFNGGLSYLIFRRNNIKLAFFIMSIALFFITVAIPVQFGDKAWTTITWAAEGAALIWLAFTLRMPKLRIYGYVVFVVMVLRLLFFDTSVELSTFQPVLNERLLAFLVGIAALYFTCWRERKTLLNKDVVWVYYPILLVANFLSIWVLSFEVWNYFDRQLILLSPGDSTTRVALQNAQNLSLTGLWALYAATALVIGIIKRFYSVRVWALALLMIVIGKVFIYDVFQLEIAYRIVAFIGLGLILLISAYLYQRYSRAIRGFLKK